jgi:hypothetical protein
MFARNVLTQLKWNMVSDYARAFVEDVLPLLHRQNGFKEAITYSSPVGFQVTLISLWDSKADADAYNTNTYPGVLKMLARFTEGTPQVESFDVVNLTYHKLPVAVPA